eukprot:223504_1
MASSNNHILRPSRNNPIMRVNGVDIDTRIYTTGIERSKYVKNVLRLSGELELRLKPLCKLDYSYQKSKNKKYIGFNIPKHCIYTQFQMYQVFAKLFNPDRSKRPSVNKACLDVFGAIDSDPSQGKCFWPGKSVICMCNIKKNTFMCSNASNTHRFITYWSLSNGYILQLNMLIPAPLPHYMT